MLFKMHIKRIVIKYILNSVNHMPSINAECGVSVPCDLCKCFQSLRVGQFHCAAGQVNKPLTLEVA